MYSVNTQLVERQKEVESTALRKGIAGEALPMFERNMATFHRNPSIKIVTKLLSNNPRERTALAK